MKLSSSTTLMLGLTSLTMLSGLILTSTKASADNDSVTDDVEITVPTSCTMSGNIATGQEHTATLSPGTYSAALGSDYENGIGTTTLTTFCNDNNGFSIYAIGYTGNTYGDNTLVGSNTGQTIATKAYQSTDTTSNWSMKVDKVENPQSGDPITYNPANMTIASDNEGLFSTWHTVPDTYTKVAEYTSTTGPATTDTALGAKLETTYATYISTTQPADTYTGQVKYVMVHPSTAPAPTVPTAGPNPPTSCNTPFPATGITYMQDINSTNKSAVLASLTPEQAYYLRDSRDNEPYCVSKLKDGNLWMLDNLRLDLTDSTTLANTTELTTNASATSLGYLKNGGGTTSDQYAITAVSDWAEWVPNPTYDSSSSYSDPLIATSGDCDDTDYCANDPESGTWTKDSLPPDQDGQHTYYGNGSGKIGIYYNYCAASAGSYCYGDGDIDSGEPSGDATEDICPKNWRMPTGGDESGEYYTLYGYYNSTEDADNANSLQYNLSTPLSGTFDYGSAYLQGYYGFFWSSSLGNQDNMFYLDVVSSGVRQYYDSRYHGYSVRCLVGA